MSFSVTVRCQKCNKDEREKNNAYGHVPADRMQQK